jgi:hypothetical protein
MKMPITRRTVLKGMMMGGVTTLALPILEMFLNSNGTAFADGAALPTRFVLMFWGNGTRIDKWVPSMTGTNYPLSPVLAPYAPVKDYLSVVTGTRCQIGGIVHHWGVAGMLSAAAYVSPTVGTVTTLSQPTIDQVVAASIGTSTRYKSLEVGVFSPTKSDEGTTLQYLSHNGPNNVNPAEYSPAALFQRLFGQSTLTQSYGSVLDTVLSDINSLSSRVSSADKARLDAYYTNLRTIETNLTPSASAACAPAVNPGDDSADMSTIALVTARSNAMWGLINTALSCDLTRVVSVHYCGSSDCIMVPPEVFQGIALYEGGSTPLPNDVTHGMTHNESTYDQPVVQAWSTFYQTQFSNFLQQMKATSDGAGNLLDNSAVMILSELSQGRSHSNLHMPILLAGKASGKLVYPGIHFAGNAPNFTAAPAATPANTYDANGDITTDSANFMNATNAQLTVMRALGMPQTSYGLGGAATSSVIDALLT